jgi:hypothetical protein
MLCDSVFGLWNVLSALVEETRALPENRAANNASEAAVIFAQTIATLAAESMSLLEVRVLARHLLLLVSEWLPGLQTMAGLEVSHLHANEARVSQLRLVAGAESCRE